MFIIRPYYPSAYTFNLLHNESKHCNFMPTIPLDRPLLLSYPTAVEKTKIQIII